MLHIMLLILKIIGIILAVILGLIVLLICIVLFVPVRYQATAKSDGDIKSSRAALRVTWLLKLIQINARFENGNLRYSIRIAWKKITGGKKHEETKIEKELKDEPEYTSPEPVSDPQIQKMAEESKESSQSISEESKESGQSILEENKEKSSLPEENEKEPKKIPIILNKLKDFIRKIKCTFVNICDKMKEVSEKKDKILQFIQDKGHKEALIKLKNESFKLLRRLKPKKLMIKARVGFDDPSTTGNLLVVLSILYPFIGENIEITPDFEQRILKGQMMVKGRIFIVHFVCLAWNLIWCKQVRRLYKDVRNFKL